jgi:hypothetical protein
VHPWCVRIIDGAVADAYRDADDDDDDDAEVTVDGGGDDDGDDDDGDGDDDGDDDDDDGDPDADNPNTRLRIPRNRHHCHFHLHRCQHHPHRCSLPLFSMMDSMVEDTMVMHKDQVHTMITVDQMSCTSNMDCGTMMYTDQIGYLTITMVSMVSASSFVSSQALPL